MKRLELSAKNVDASGFSLAEMLLSSSSQGPKGSLRERADLYFQDSQFLPLFVQENYCNFDASQGLLLAEFSRRHMPPEAATLEAIAQASDSISLVWSLLGSCVCDGTC